MWLLRRLTAILCLVGVFAAAHGAAAEPVTIRISWVIVPGELVPILFAHPGIAQHDGRSYVLEPIHFSGGPLSIAALAKSEIDIGGLGYATIANAIEGAGIEDLTVIGDVAQDGVPGWFSVQYLVLKDGPVHAIGDLKHKTLGVNTLASMIDAAQRAMLRQHEIDDRKDVTIIEVATPNMKAALAAHKVDMIGAQPQLVADPELQAIARPLFRQVDAVGTTQISALVARRSLIAAHRAAVVDLLEDTIRATRWYLDPANHAEAVKIAADFNKASPAAVDWAFTHRDQYRSPDLMPNTEALQRNIDTLWKLGLLKARLDMAPHIDLSLVREAVSRLP